MGINNLRSGSWNTNANRECERLKLEGYITTATAANLLNCCPDLVKKKAGEPHKRVKSNRVVINMWRRDYIEELRK